MIPDHLDARPKLTIRVSHASAARIAWYPPRRVRHANGDDVSWR